MPIKDALLGDALASILVVLAVTGACSPSSEQPGEAAVLTRNDGKPSSGRQQAIAAARASALKFPQYRFEPTPSAGSASEVALGASNPALGLATKLTSHGAQIAVDGTPWQVTFSLAGLGCGQELEAVDTVAPALGVSSEAHYLRHAARYEVDEWYANGPLGIEQGFTIARASCPSGDLFVEVKAAGLQPRLAADSAAVELVDASGKVALHYSDASSKDAHDRRLATSLSVHDDRVRLRVAAQNAVFPIVVDPLIWVYRQKQVSSTDAQGGAFGQVLAISGDTLLVGAPMDPSPAHVYVRVDPNWYEQAQLPATGGGQAVALDGDTAIVGAPSDSEGSAYVFVRSGSTWTQQQKLTASDNTGSGPDQFGYSVAVSGDVALIGKEPNAFGMGAGAAYVFTRTAGVWTEQKKLTDPDAMPYSSFGNRLALSGGTALVGGGAGVHFFVGSGSSWSLQQTVPAGFPLALSGDTALVSGSDTRGFVNVYTRSGSTWSIQQKLSASDEVDSNYFGQAVALSGDTALVGASKPRAAYVFARSGSTWTEQKQLLPPSPDYYFGASVAVSNDVAVVGANLPYIQSASEEGAVYFWDLRKADGDVCGSDNECASRTCVDSRCCNTSCGGLCDACSVAAGAAKDGECSILAAGSLGSPACGLQTCNGVSANCSLCTTDDQCPPGTFCNTAGLCFARKNPGQACSLVADCKVAGCRECMLGSCADGVCCNQACDGACDACSVAKGASLDGTCATVAAGSTGTPACGTLACTGASKDCAACSQDSQCPDGRYCTAQGECQPRKTQGAGCDAAAGADCKTADCRVCESGHCADGFCCDSACGGCSACAASLTGGTDGACSPVSEGLNHAAFCVANPDPDLCLADGVCDGTGKCRDFAPRGIPCGATECSDGKVSGQLCSGEGNCDTGSSSCGKYLCKGDACAASCTTDDGCIAAAYCKDGACETKQARGDACLEDGECATGHCVDGVCCNSACEGQCEACNVDDDTTGTCTPVQGAPLGGRPACSAGDGQDPCTETLCDGIDGQLCAGFVGAKVVCRTASCSGETAIAKASCDESGVCPEVTPSGCSPYQCAGNVCGTTCANDTECADKFRCEKQAGECVARDTTSCLADGSTQSNPDGTSKDCAPYVCEGIACLMACTNTTQCAESFICDSESGHCETAPAAATDDAGCACQLPGRSRSAAWPGLVLLALVTSRLRRRRRGLRLTLAA